MNIHYVNNRLICNAEAISTWSNPLDYSTEGTEVFPYIPLLLIFGILASKSIMQWCIGPRG